MIRAIIFGCIALLVPLPSQGRPPPVRARPVQPRVKKKQEQQEPQQQQAGQQPAGATPSALLKEAESYYEQLEYETALKILIKVHAAQGVTDVQRARAYLYMGVCFTALGNPNNAIAAFIEVLKRRPDFRMPAGVSPSIRAMFEEATKRVQGSSGGAEPAGQGGGEASSGGGKGDVVIDARTSARVLVGKPVKVAIDLDDPKKLVRKVAIFWRRRKGPDFSRVLIDVTPGKTKFETTIPAGALGKKPGTLTFYAEAQDGNKQVLDTAGDEEKPYEMLLVTHLKQSRSKVGWWWFAAGGAAAVVGVIVTVLATQGSDDPAVPQDKASLTVILR